MEKKFNGDIVIFDPSYCLTEGGYELSSWGQNLDKIGFTDFMYIDFPDDPVKVVDEFKNVLGGICQDSCCVVVAYLNELEKHNPNFITDAGDEDNITIIKGFNGVIDYKIVDVIIDGEEDTDTVIYGKGNINFTTTYDD